jgi:phospholipid/cholesterol/gamma-HCH transport system permease protein
MGDGETAPAPNGVVPSLAEPIASPPGWLDFVDQVGAIGLLTRDTFVTLVRHPPPARLVIEQMEQIGWRSLSIVGLTAVFTGMVLALQLGTYMERFGAKMFVSRIVGISLLRELGPVLTALLFGGRVGAGITAEIGSMAVTEQVDAIRALGASPIRNLVAPRLLATIIMLPALSVIGDVLGLLGGLFISVTELNVGAAFYVNSLLQILLLEDVLSGLGKTVFFAYFIAIIACHNGLRVSGGADGVGRATTSTVVAASITILVSDFFLTKLFMLL